MNAWMHTWPHTHLPGSTSGCGLNTHEKNMNMNCKQWHVKLKGGLCARQRNIKVWSGSLASSMWDTGSLLGLLPTPAIFLNGQLFLWPSLLAIQGWMLGIVGFSLVCGVLLEHAQMKSDARRAKSADHTDLIHRGCWVLVRAPWAPSDHVP